MKQTTIKVFQLTETEIQKLLRIALDQMNVPPPDNMKMFTASAIAQLKKLES